MLHPKRLFRTLLFLLLCVVSVTLVLRVRPPQAPAFIVQTHAAITGALQYEGAWYWLEGAGKPGSRLVRANAAGALPIASADQIQTFAVGEGKVAWAAQEGNRWSVTLAASDGSDLRTRSNGARLQS